jgi:hypothetical protein
MVELRRHGSAVASAFDLLGTNENDLTSALGGFADCRGVLRWQRRCFTGCRPPAA